MDEWPGKILLDGPTAAPPSMETLVFQANGRKKKIFRSMRMNCKGCGASLPCPPGENFWGWLKSDMVNNFKFAHSTHGNAAVGAEMTIDEID